jgi:hypothetical protein
MKRLPDGEWFGLRSVPFMVRNPRWRCDRLTEKGALESRIVGEWPHTNPEWRKTPNEKGERLPGSGGGSQSNQSNDQ